MDDMAALNESLTVRSSGHVIDCSSCVEDLKSNKCIGYILLKMISEALISLHVAMHTLVRKEFLLQTFFT